MLLAILVVVLLYAGSTVLRRRARNDWTRTLNVALVLVRVGKVDDAAVEALRARTWALEEVLARELHRYRTSPAKPFAFVVRGPTDVATPPPEPQGDGVVALLRSTWDRSRWVDAVDRAAGLKASAYDARIYLVVRAPQQATARFVEGASEQGGGVGTIEVELDDTMVDHALFVAVHELMHTLGALDKYDETGRVLVPRGLAEPDAVPQVPQAFVEVMARTRPAEGGVEKAPERIEELRVNAFTAAEIGWKRP